MLFTVWGVPTYGVVHLAALWLYLVLALVLFRRARLPWAHVAALTGIYGLCNFLFAKVLFDVVKGDGLRPLGDYFTAKPYLEGGLWGWLVVFLPCVLVYPFVVGLRDRVAYFRCVALLLPPVLAVQKLACFAAGCCGGCSTSVPWAVTFPEGPLVRTPGVPVHPLQLYDAALAVLILVVLVVVDRRGGEAARPFLFPLFVILYGLSRFASEFLRQRAPGEEDLLLLSQKLEGLVAVAGVLFLLFGWRAWRGLLRAGGTAAGPP
jgi:prolipoprotein diacylglyceryltransferase